MLGFKSLLFTEGASIGAVITHTGIASASLESREPTHRATLDKLLMVTAQARFIETERQPKRMQMCAQLLSKASNNEDKKACKQLADGNLKTLKDFILFRAELPPTQTLDEILGLLNYKDYKKIHQHNLLTNLIYAHTSGAINIYELGTILQRYSFLRMVQKFAEHDYRTESMRQQIAAGVTVVQKPAINNNQLIPEMRPYFWFEGPLNDEQLEESTLIPSKHVPLNDVVAFTMNQTEPERISAFMAEVDELHTDLGHTVNSGYAMIPMHILLQTHMQAKPKSQGYMLPLPVIGCFDLKMLEETECDLVDGVSFRPVTLPSLLDPDLRALFTGAEAIEEHEDLAYGAYDANAKTPGFKDMTKAHYRYSTSYGVLHHDMTHVTWMNCKHKSLNLELLVGIIKTVAQLEAAAIDPNAKRHYARVKEGILDSGYKANWTREILCRVGAGSEHLYPDRYGARGLDMWVTIIKAIPPRIKQLLIEDLVYDFNHSHWRDHGISADFQKWFTDAFGVPFEPDSEVALTAAKSQRLRR